jgi:hypothetical protein
MPASPVLAALHDDPLGGQWIICPECAAAGKPHAVDVGYWGVCGCGTEMERVYTEDAIKRAEEGR